MFAVGTLALEATLSNVNDSFTLSRLMKGPKHVLIQYVMSTHNLRVFFVFFLNIQKAFQQCLSLFDVELRPYLNAVHLYLIGSHVKVTQVVNSVDYESASNMPRFI